VGRHFSVPLADRRHTAQLRIHVGPAYTVALLAFPIVSTPQSTFDIVGGPRAGNHARNHLCERGRDARCCRGASPSAISAQADAWLDRCTSNSAWMSSPAVAAIRKRDNERIRLAAVASEIDQLGRHLDYEATTSANVARRLAAPADKHMLSLLPLLGSIEDRKLALNLHEEVSACVAGICTRTSAMARRGRSRWTGSRCVGARRLMKPGRRWMPMRAGPTSRSLVWLSGLRNLVDVMQDCRLLREGDRRWPAIRNRFRSPSHLTRRRVAVPHRDPRARAPVCRVCRALSVLACCGFWIATGWPDGVTAPLFAAVLGSLLAGADDPLPTFRNFYGVFLVVIAVNGIYVFGVFPRITALLEMLIAALMPAFLLFGWMAARPATCTIGSMLAIYISVQLALNSSYSADFSSFANSGIADDAGALR